MHAYTYRASTGKNLDKDGVFGDDKSAYRPKQSKMHARDRIRMYRSLEKRQTVSDSYGEVIKGASTKSPQRTGGSGRSPLRAMSVNSPKRYERGGGRNSPKVNDTTFSKHLSVVPQKESINMRNILESAAIKLQPNVSLYMSPLQQASTLESPLPINRVNEVNGVGQKCATSGILGKVKKNAVTNQPQVGIAQKEHFENEEYRIFLEEMKQEQSLRYTEVRNQKVKYYMETCLDCSELTKMPLLFVCSCGMSFNLLPVIGTLGLFSMMEM